MAATNKAFLVEQLLGGVDTTSPSHLVLPPRWRTAHNMRLEPTVQQVERKALHTTIAAGGNILALPIVPGYSPGWGTVLALNETSLRTLSGTQLSSSLVSDSSYRRWSTTVYNGLVFYVNELNPIHVTDGASNTLITNAPAGRYVGAWYDHLIVGAPTYKGETHPNRVMWSDLYGFSTWEPDATNEADYYDCVEWQMPDFPYQGVTGMARLGALWWVYTPTAIIPFRYVGLRQGHGVEVVDELVLTRIGNTYPWTMVPLDKVHFFFDGIEMNFFAFDGQNPVPIGEPVKGFMLDYLNRTPALAAKMWGTVDVANSEIWWRFVSTASAGAFDKAVVFNYRTKNWYTASTENIHAFSGAMFPQGKTSELSVAISALSGSVGTLGQTASQVPRLYGSAAGVIYRDEISSDATSSLIAQDDPILESGDFLYGTLYTQKECRAMAVNAYWDATQNPSMKLEVDVAARDYLDDPLNWSDTKHFAGYWTNTLQNGRLTHDYRTGKVIRFRFVGKNARGLRFSAYEPTIYSRGAEA